jgi:hypothetical protein
LCKWLASSAGDGIRESQNSAASAVNGLVPLPPDDKVGAEIQQDIKIDVTGGGGPTRLYRR